MPWRDMNIVFIPQTRSSSVDLNLADFFLFLLWPHHYGPEDIQYAAATASKKGLELKSLTIGDLARKRIEDEGDALTFEDLDCLNRGLPLPTYDAFILYSEEDAEIIGDIVKNLEAQVCW